MAEERQEERKEVVETAAVAAAEATWPQTRAILRVIFIALAVAGTLFVLYKLEGILLLVVLAIFFAYLIAPLVELVRRPFLLRGRSRELPRAVAIGVVYAVLFGSLFLTLYLLSPRLTAQLEELAKAAPRYLENANARAQSLNRFYETLNLPPALRKYANDNITKLINEAGNYAGGQGVDGVLAVLGYVPWLILVPILAFFLLKDADSFRRSALQMLPRGRIRWRGDEFFQDVNSTLAAYIRAQLIACLLIGVICTIGFMLIGVRYALVLGVIAGVLEFIPLVGPLIVLLIACMVASFYSVNQIIAVIIFLGVLRIVHDYVTYPRIIGSGIHLHPLAVILAILSGHEMAGVAGIFLAIPMIAILTVTYRHWLEHRGSSGIVADLLKPAEQAVTAPPSDGDQAPAPAPVKQPTPTGQPAT
ncbi:MAG TPA: AI-2E family transporter [Pyrinomonadaceae bacterium]|nr:AI-2E family transporter [Pyrinomonadaceae bacterium]